MTHSVVASYAAHRAAVALHNGGESAEWPEIADALAACYLDRLGELPLARPLRFAWGYTPRQPNGEWPNLVVVHQRSVPVHLDSVWREWTHAAQVVLICGPWGNDPGAMQALGTPYIDPLVRVLDENQSLDGRVKKIEIGPDGLQWQILSYGAPARAVAGPPQWYGLTVPLLIYGQAVRRWQS